jgi:hypothetical protein
VKIALTPMGPRWLRKTQHEIQRREREHHGGAQYFADDFEVIPGEALDKATVAAKAEAEYGPPVDPRKRRGDH